ncbi:MAG: hypothetical protein AAGJ87_01845 [Pseudomonadota bacterium]
MRELKQTLPFIADYAREYRERPRSADATASAADLRRVFRIPLNDAPAPGDDVIKALINAAEPGLVGNTDPGFFAWVMGASDPVGVAADRLTSVWGQNSAIYQTAPAAAVAEEAVSACCSVCWICPPSPPRRSSPARPWPVSRRRRRPAAPFSSERVGTLREKGSTPRRP